MSESAVSSFPYVVVRDMRRAERPPILEQPQRRSTLKIGQKIAGQVREETIAAFVLNVRDRAAVRTTSERAKDAAKWRRRYSSRQNQKRPNTQQIDVHQDNSD